MDQEVDFNGGNICGSDPPLPQGLPYRATQVVNCTTPWNVYDVPQSCIM